MDPFSPRLLQIADGNPAALRPVPFSGRVDELTLERWIVANPELVGEPLLVLGHQLAEFEEDKDRLDILALDRFGEIVLVELKVSEEFRVTDLQALAYAGAYARRSRKDLARTLQRHLQKRADATAVKTAALTTIGNADEAAPAPNTPVSLEDAAAEIAVFIEVDSFEEWQPSQHVRIKLVAPSFPRRVLQTVKWLGDVYDVRLEAIVVRLFETGPQRYSIAFERLLPLPAEQDFDMTIRERENRQLVENTTRQPSVLPALVSGGHLVHGQQLWVTKTVLLKEDRSRWNPDSPVFQVRVHAPPGAQPKLAWRSKVEEEEEILSPSAIAYRVYLAVVPDWTKEFSTAVAPNFSVAPNGKTLGDLAYECGVWQQAVDTT